MSEVAPVLHSNFKDVVLPPLPRLPRMISAAEGRYYYWLTSRVFQGEGMVVEVGPWLGCSSLHLAAGLRDAGYCEHLHCIDQFEWKVEHLDKSSLQLKTGADFQPVFENNLRPIYPKIVSSKANILDFRWEGGPIEVLVFDAPKQLATLSAGLACFGPHLIPGRSLIVFEDYVHAPSYPVAAVVSQLHESLELVHIVKNSAALGFRLRRSVDWERLQSTSWNFRNWSEAEAYAAWERVLAPLAPRSRARMESGLAMLLYDAGHVQSAIDLMRRLPFGKGDLRRRWQYYAQTALFDFYEPLFRTVDITPQAGALGATYHHARRRRWLRRLAQPFLSRSWGQALVGNVRALLGKKSERPGRPAAKHFS